ncbi:CAP domain-containing protein [Conexibacter arvalis]|uniref:Uncharacterized protein YkwD n=1 Tax=Conexibacter arvalis TaxID=912552 RepID=A0A840IJI3_9ACTN|nr:CAP domain-containing protein [Conexibacter arvalis]MBB4665247.1 uncharacterized protein YkwD [Conexibacter arvalis]
MRHRLLTSLATLVALAGVLALPATSNAAPSKSRPGACSAAAARVAVSAETISTATSATLCLLNRERSRRGLRPLKLDRHLSAVARAHSRDMVRRGYFEHNSPNGRTPFDRILATRYVPRGASWALGENIGWGTDELAQPASLVNAWMKSPGHRRNILDKRFREIGIGIVTGVPTRDPGLRGQAGATYTTDFGSTAK